MKRCPRCLEEKPPEGFYLRRGRPSGYCKPCQKQFTREWERAHPERDREIKRAARRRYKDRHRKPPKPRLDVQWLTKPNRRVWSRFCPNCREARPPTDFPWQSNVCFGCRTEKACSVCKVVKPYSEFSPQKSKRDGRTSRCKPCQAEASARWAEANPEKAKRSKHRNWALIGPPTPFKRCRSCHETLAAADFHIDRYERDGLNDKCKVCRLNWVYGVDRTEIFAREGGVCHICRRPVAFAVFHVEHLFPRAAGGTDDPSNLAIAHPSCNSRKGGRPVEVQLRLA